MSTRQQTVTRLLVGLAGGDDSHAGELLPLVYDELRALAGAYFRQERAEHTLQPTALVHEAYIRLVDQTSIEWKSRNQFFFIASRAMRNILVDHARSKNRQKRGGEGWQRIPLDDIGGGRGGPEQVDMLALDDALEKLAKLDERKARLVELRFFGGLKAEDAADLLGFSRTTAAEEWRMARAWLRREMRDDRA